MSVRRERRASNARQIATLFKGLAVLAVAFGFVATIGLGASARRAGHPASSVVAMVVSGVATVLLSSGLAFFGYVLDLLADIREELAEQRQ